MGCLLFKLHFSNHPIRSKKCITDFIAHPMRAKICMTRFRSIELYIYQRRSADGILLLNILQRIWKKQTSTTMAAAQVKLISDLSTKPTCATSDTVTAAEFQLSDKTKVTAHPGDKWKAGYLTISRVTQAKGGWRNVHVSKRSFEKFAEKAADVLEALNNKVVYHVMLTKKQHVLTTVFEREGKVPLFYVSLLHPKAEKETLSKKDEVNHAKTINLNPEEFRKFTLLLEKLLQVVRSKSGTPENEESVMIDCFRWTFKESGQRSSKLFPTREQCSKDADLYYFQVNKDLLQAQPMEYEYESSFEFNVVQVERPGKVELIEHLAYACVLQMLRAKDVETEKSPPSEKDVDRAIEDLDMITFKVAVKKVMNKLAYKNVYLSSELVGLFMYLDGMKKVKSCLTSHRQPAEGKLYTRLIDYCYQSVSDDMCKE